MKALSIEKGKRHSKEDVIFGVVNYTLFAVFTLICVYPVSYTHLYLCPENEGFSGAH